MGARGAAHSRAIVARGWGDLSPGEGDRTEAMEKKKVAIPLVCHGHSRPVVDLFYSPVTPDGYFLISASKGKRIPHVPSRAM